MEGLCNVLLVWFEVSVNNAVVMEILQSQHGLSEVHACHIHRQRPDMLQERGTVSTCPGAQDVGERWHMCATGVQQTSFTCVLTLSVSFNKCVNLCVCVCVYFH